VPASQTAMHASRRNDSPAVRSPAPDEPVARTKSRRRWILIAVAAWLVIVPIACGEIVLRMASRLGVLLFDVEMWRYARQVKRISERPGVVLEHRPNAEATLMGVQVRTDERGFRRASPEIEALRPTGRPERLVAVVGDSCALGWGVPEGQTVSEHLETMLNPEGGEHRTVVLNAGVGNSNTAMEYARYLQDIRPLRPDWVVLAYFINDAEPNPPAKRSLLLDQSVLFATMSTRLPLLMAPSYRDYRQYFANLYEPASPGLESHRRALADFGRALQEDGVPGTLLLIPEMHEPNSLASFAGIYRDVAALGKESGFLDVVDPSSDFAPGPGESYWVTPGDPHPNGEAHRILAAALARSEGARRLASPRADAAPSAAGAGADGASRPADGAPLAPNDRD
jgi:lysophospholipase L1-like esterase